MPLASSKLRAPVREGVPTLKEPRYSQSLERGLAILGCFTPDQPIRRVIDIAHGLGMTPSTTHRYMTTLVALGYLNQESSREYRLGLRVTDLGMAALNATDLRSHTRPYLEELRRQTSYTVGVAVLDGTETVLVDIERSHRRGQHMIDNGLLPGSRQPAYCTAAGKLLLAHLPQDELGDLLSEMKLTRRAANTIISKRALRDELASIHETGLATSDEELDIGLYTMAVPVCSIGGKVAAAMDLAAHSAVISLEEMVDYLGPHLSATASRLSAQLGYRREDETAHDESIT
jgi:IclR family transcriptional regulator, pca regulon regulatory protein